MSQTIAESIWEEGYSKGEVKGEIKGALNTARGVLRQLLTHRFGSVPESVLKQIESVTDVDRLTTAAVQVSHLAAPEDLQL